MKRSIALVVLGSLLLAACAESRLAGSVVQGTLPVFDSGVTVVDEGGEPLEARLTLTDGSIHESDNGVIGLDLAHPVAGVLRADGMLDQPVIIDHARDAVVTMLARVGPGGSIRRAFHVGVNFGGKLRPGNECCP